MNVELSPDSSQIVESLVAAGHYPSVNEAIDEGVKLLMARDRLRQDIQVGYESTRIKQNQR
jgi:putative addiction module CopG family antidote